MAEDDKRRLNQLIVFSLVVTGFIAFTAPSFTRAAGLYFGLGLAILVFNNSGVIKDSFGLGRSTSKDILYGVAGGAAFIIINRIIPTFSLLTPTTPFALADTLKGLIIVFLAPVFEEAAFRGGLLTLLQELYNLSFGWANKIQAAVFALLHLLAYGVFLEQLANLQALFGATAAISGLLVAALAFGIYAGYLRRLSGSLLPPMVAHAIINGFLFFQLVAVVV